MEIQHMSESNVIMSDKAPSPVGLYPHARRVGNLLFLSGVGPHVCSQTTGLGEYFATRPEQPTSHTTISH